MLLLLAIAPVILFLAKAITPIMAIIIKIDNFVNSSIPQFLPVRRSTRQESLNHNSFFFRHFKLVLYS
jgi:uncharacterized membrane protein